MVRDMFLPKLDGMDVHDTQKFFTNPNSVSKNNLKLHPSYESAIPKYDNYNIDGILVKPPAF